MNLDRLTRLRAFASERALNARLLLPPYGVVGVVRNIGHVVLLLIWLLADHTNAQHASGLYESRILRNMEQPRQGRSPATA